MTALSPRILFLDGDLDLNGPNTDPSGLTFRIDTLGEGTQWGNPESITRMVSSWLADGSIITHDRDDNRDLTVPVRVTADSSAALAAGESALFNRCNRATTLEWTPPWNDDAPVTTVFEVWSGALAGDLQSNGGDLNELRLTRFYTLTLTAKPYSRSQAMVNFAALSKPATQSTVQIDDCSSATGWTGSPNTAASTGVAVTETITTEVSSRLGGGRQAGGATYHLSLTRTGAVDMTGFPYLRVNFSMPGISWDPKVHADGVLLTQVASSGRIRWYKAPASFSTLKVGGSFYTNRELTVVLSVFNVSQTNVAGVVGTDKELARTVWVEGSARTSGSIAVEHATTGLGTTIVYSCPSSPAGYVPSMTSYWTAGPVRSADTAAVSGFKNAIDLISISAAGGAFPTFTIPGSQVVEGDYGVMLRVKAAAAGDYPVSVTSYVDGLDTFISATSALVTFPDTSYQLVWMGRLTLPTQAIPATSDRSVIAVVRALTSAVDVDMDELWLFNLTDGALSIIEAGTDQRVWLDSADGERSNPTIWVGSAADRSDAVAAALSGTVRALGSHALLPGYMDLFTVTTGAADADASVTYYPRWHTHAVL